MIVQNVSLETCASASGVVVVIDVIRAFTTAAFAFAAGATEIHLVSEAEEALALRERLPGSLVMGEVGGLPVEGFDFGNSPTHLVGVDLTGRRLIQRTSAGTQGVVRSTAAGTLLASSFVVAEATVRKLRQLAPPQVTFVITGARPPEALGIASLDVGDEDLACAEYLAARIRGEQPDPQPYLARVFASRSPEAIIAQGFGDLIRSDLRHCAELDRFDFAMQVQREAGSLVLRAIR